MQPHIFAEIYVRDVAKTAAVLGEILGMTVKAQQADFAELQLGTSRMPLNELRLDEFEAANPIHKPGAVEHLGAGLELGIYVDDLLTAYKRGQAADIPYLSAIKTSRGGCVIFDSNCLMATTDV